MKNAQNDVGKFVDDEYKWGHNLDVQVDDRSITKRHLFGMQCSHRLWCDLPEDNDQYG